MWPPDLSASEVLWVQMFKAALSYLCSFSKFLPYSLGPCGKKLLIYHRLLTPPPAIHLLAARGKRSIRKCSNCKMAVRPRQCPHLRPLAPHHQASPKLAFPVKGVKFKETVSVCAHSFQVCFLKNIYLFIFGCVGSSLLCVGFL